MNSEDETAITEITIAPDGRVLLFGLSCEVLEVLSTLFPSDSAVAARLAQLRMQNEFGLVKQNDVPLSTSLGSSQD